MSSESVLNVLQRRSVKSMVGECIFKLVSIWDSCRR